MDLRQRDYKLISKIYNGKKVKLNDGYYYTKLSLSEHKFNDLDGAVTELIGYHVAKIFDLICPKYYIVLNNNTNNRLFKRSVYSILSEDLNREGKFLTAYDMGLHYEEGSSLYTIWDHMEEIMGYNPELFAEVIRMYIMDILLSIPDRKPNNWGFLQKDGKYRVAVIDNEELLIRRYEPLFITPFDSKKWYEVYDATVSKGEENAEKEKYVKKMLEANLRSFLSQSSEEFIDLFNYYYELLTPEYIENMLHEVERENVVYTKYGEVPLKIPHKDLMISMYKKNYELITKVFKEYSEKRSR